MNSPQYKNFKISWKQVGFLLLISLCPQISLRVLRDISEAAGSGGWLIILASGIFALIHCAVLTALLQKYPGSTLIDIGNIFAGKIGRIIVALLNCIFFFNQFIVLLYALSISFKNILFPNTPIAIIVFLLVALNGYALFQGLESLARTAWILAPFLLLALIGIFFFAFQHSDIDTVTPILGKGLYPIAVNCFHYFYLFANIFLLNILNKYICEPNKLKLSGFCGLGGAIITTLLFNFSVTTVFGPELASILNFPVLHLTRLFSLYEYFQHFDALFIFLWFFVTEISLCTFLGASVNAFVQIFALKQRHWNFIFVLVPALLAVMLLINFDPEFKLSMLLVRIVNPPIAFGLPSLMWLFSLWHKRKEQSNVQ